MMGEGMLELWVLRVVQLWLHLRMELRLICLWVGVRIWKRVGRRLGLSLSLDMAVSWSLGLRLSLGLGGLSMSVSLHLRLRHLVGRLLGLGLQW